MCLEENERKKTNYIDFSLTRPEIIPVIKRNGDEHINQYTSDTNTNTDIIINHDGHYSTLYSFTYIYKYTTD